MTKKFSHSELVLATHNRGKVKELQELLASFDVKVTSAHDHHVTEPDETGVTFAENAELKARHTFEHTDLPSLADDSGLCIDALQGEPGVYSANWAMTEDGSRDFQKAMKKVLDRLKGETNRRAYFACTLALVTDDGEALIVEGRVEGVIVDAPRGTSGFGYDPIFMPDGYDKTFGELNDDVKNNISHRADAFKKFITACFK